MYHRDMWVGLESKIVLDGFKIALSLVSTVCINYFVQNLYVSRCPSRSICTVCTGKAFYLLKSSLSIESQIPTIC